MAYIDNIYIHVTDENLAEDVEVSSHPVEQGIDITDTVKRQAGNLSISGVIANYELAGTEISAGYVISLLKVYKNKGRLVTYKGRNICGNYQIVSFSTGHANSVWGGATFDMTLQECRIAKNAYVEPKIDESSVKNGGQQQVEKGENEKVYYTTKSGDTLWGLVCTKRDGKTPADYANLKREGAAAGHEGAWKWVMTKNPHAFSKPNVPESLQVEKKLYLGDR